MHVARERVLGASPSDGHTQGVTRPGDAGSGSADLELPTCSGGCAWSAPAARNTNLIDAFSVAHDLAGTKEIDRAARRPEPDTCPGTEARATPPRATSSLPNPKHGAPHANHSNIMPRAHAHSVAQAHPEKGGMREGRRSRGARSTRRYAWPRPQWRHDTPREIERAVGHAHTLLDEHS
jgi:hypothetical protein